MIVNVAVELDVGDNPTADGITYFIEQYGQTEGDDTHSPEEWVERVVVDILTAELDDATRHGIVWEITEVRCGSVER